VLLAAPATCPDRQGAAWAGAGATLRACRSRDPYVTSPMARGDPDVTLLHEQRALQALKKATRS
jgi:hypothetical protein